MPSFLIQLLVSWANTLVAESIDTASTKQTAAKNLICFICKPPFFFFYTPIFFKLAANDSNF
jgi:hypothetical protein